jgi:hypothetical protein
MISALLDNQAWEILGGILMYQVRHPYHHLLFCLLTLELFSSADSEAEIAVVSPTLSSKLTYSITILSS